MSKKDCPPVVSDEKYAAGVPLEDEFTPMQCMELVKTKFKGDNLELGAVVDLTFTKRYYNPQVRFYGLERSIKVMYAESCMEFIYYILNFSLFQAE